jgi:hypothetical protein
MGAHSGVDDTHAAILALWSEYRDGIYEGDANRLAAIFHPAASMFYVSGGDLVVTPIAKYFDIVRNRAAPRASGAGRRERLVSLAVPSPDSAVLTATILILQKSFTDQLVLMKQQDKWLIVAKTYHLDEELPVQ